MFEHDAAYPRSKLKFYKIDRYMIYTNLYYILVMQKINTSIRTTI